MRIWSKHKETTNEAESTIEFIPYGMHEVTSTEKLNSAIQLSRTLVHQLDPVCLFYVQAFLAENEFLTEDWAKSFAERVGFGY